VSLVTACWHWLPFSHCTSLQCFQCQCQPCLHSCFLVSLPLTPLVINHWCLPLILLSPFLLLFTVVAFTICCLHHGLASTHAMPHFCFFSYHHSCHCLLCCNTIFLNANAVSTSTSPPAIYCSSCCCLLGYSAAICQIWTWQATSQLHLPWPLFTEMQWGSSECHFLLLLCSCITTCLAVAWPVLTPVSAVASGWFVDCYISPIDLPWPFFTTHSAWQQADATATAASCHCVTAVAHSNVLRCCQHQSQHVKQEFAKMFLLRP